MNRLLLVPTTAALLVLTACRGNENVDFVAPESGDAGDSGVSAGDAGDSGVSGGDAGDSGVSGGDAGDSGVSGGDAGQDGGPTCAPAGGACDSNRPCCEGVCKGQVCASATARDINTDQVPAGTPVTISGLVLTGIAKFDGKTSTGGCKYVAWAQDPAGQAPCGIQLFVQGPSCTPTDGGTCVCPYPPATASPADQLLTLGDALNVNGRANSFLPAGQALKQHEIVVTSVTRTGQGGVIVPTVFVNGTEFAQDSTRYQSFEGMLVTIQPATPMTVSPQDIHSGFDFAGAHFAGDYRFVYTATQPGFPTAGSSWSSITGIVNPAFHGGIAPRQSSDFVP